MIYKDHAIRTTSQNLEKIRTRTSLSRGTKDHFFRFFPLKIREVHVNCLSVKIRNKLSPFFGKIRTT